MISQPLPLAVAIAIIITSKTIFNNFSLYISKVTINCSNFFATVYVNGTHHQALLMNALGTDPGHNVLGGDVVYLGAKQVLVLARPSKR